MPRVTVDNEVHSRITKLYQGMSFNHALRRYCGLPDTNTRQPPKKRNWLDTVFHKLCDYK